MPKYKKAGKRITEDFVSSLFRAIGRGLSPVILKTLSKKDPDFKTLITLSLFDSNDIFLNLHIV